LYEAPHRLLALLEDVLAVFGDRELCVGRELTKLYEEIWRGSVSGGLAHFSADRVRGEVTVVIAGNNKQTDTWDEAAVRAALQQELGAGLSRKAATAAIAEASGWRKRDVYALSLAN